VNMLGHSRVKPSVYFNPIAQPTTAGRQSSDRTKP
jgi:hypothetical protein